MLGMGWRWMAGAVLVTTLAATPRVMAQPATADSTETLSNAELARRLDLLAREIDRLELGEAAGPPESHHGFGPAASKVYGVGRGVSIGGYGEMLYADFASQREDDTASGADARIDFVRQILYVGYKFDDHFLFNSEIEFEHASTELGGSVSVEFAYLDALLRQEVNLRAGLLLVPMGILNEMHEPPVFLGARRPESETRIIPSTWRANGLGLFGAARHGLVYRAYLIESLNAVGFDGTGLREGRQNGAEALFEDVAGVARLDYERAGARAGASLFYGATAQGPPPPGGITFDAATTLWDAHADLHLRGVRLRGLVTGAHVDEAAQVNLLRGLTGDGGGNSVGSELLGWYIEAGYDLLSRLRPESHFELVPYVRHEELDTQREVPAGYTKNPANDEQITTAGAAFYPHPQIVVKGDYQWLRNEARTGTDRWNLALGFLF